MLLFCQQIDAEIINARVKLHYEGNYKDAQTKTYVWELLASVEIVKVKFPNVQQNYPFFCEESTDAFYALKKHMRVADMLIQPRNALLTF